MFMSSRNWKAGGLILAMAIVGLVGCGRSQPSGASSTSPLPASLTPSSPHSSEGEVHDYGELIPEVEPTCTEEGMEAHYRCSLCGKLFTEEFVETTEEKLKIPALGHNYGEEISEVPSNCVQTGVRAHYRCDRCGNLFVKEGDEYREVTLEELTLSLGEHDYGELIPEDPSTCLTQGTAAHYVCSVCGKLFDKDKHEASAADLILPFAEHQYGELIPEVPATCTETGAMAHYECSVCHKLFIKVGDEYVEKQPEDLIIPKNPHKYTYVYSLTGHHQVCSICGEETEEAPHDCNEEGDCDCGFHMRSLSEHAYVDLSVSATAIDITDIAEATNNKGATTLKEGWSIYDASGAILADGAGAASTAFSQAGRQTYYLYNGNGDTAYSFTLYVADHLIGTRADLSLLQWDGKNKVTGYFVLRKDIYCGNNAISGPSYAWNANAGFAGTLDGAGHEIAHAVVGQGGLFGTLAGTIKDVTFSKFLIGGGFLNQSLLGYTSYWAALDHVTISVSSSWTAKRDAYGLLFAKEAQHLTLKHVSVDFLSDVENFDSDAHPEFHFGYVIAKSGNLKTVESTLIKTKSSNIMGDNDKDTLLSTWGNELTITDQA